MNVNKSFIYVLTLMESRNFSGIHSSLVLVTISMNLFDQLVIVSCNLVMEG